MKALLKVCAITLAFSMIFAISSGVAAMTLDVGTDDVVSGIYVGNGTITVSGTASEQSRVMLAVTKPSFNPAKYTGIEYVDAKFTEFQNNEHAFEFTYPAAANPELGIYRFTVNATAMNDSNLMMDSDLDQAVSEQDGSSTYTFNLGVEVQNFQIKRVSSIATATATLLNYDSNSPITPYIVLAAYDQETGELVKVAIDNSKTVNGWAQDELSVVLTGVGGEYDFKAFIWESLVTIKPLTGTVDTVTP